MNCNATMTAGRIWRRIKRPTISLLFLLGLLHGVGAYTYANGLENGPNLLLSHIEITSPNSATVWAVSDPVEISWKTRNIPKDKTIKFYLSRGNMVVQELGTFKNSNFVEGIKLNRTLPAGSNYRVIAMELFPNDKYRIAKFATSFFSITKAPRKQEVKTVRKEAAPAPTPLRNTFNGRKISYVKELVVDSPKIRINLWDHGRKDDDIVSIYLNGEAIVSEYYLTYHKKTFELDLDTAQVNDLFLYAHNLGRFPPNTVSIEILDGKTSENIVLNSDLRSCEAVAIKVKD
ncbi:hypothetical protein WIW50_10510 [Flavobacteriaceae bacterium 3-367]